jgi:oligopeptide/dipeptide ABC transporter ATP-binding protein
MERKRRRIALSGDVPNPMDPPPGCRFQGRCPVATEQCRRAAPPLEEKAPGHFAACWNRH